MPYQVMGSPDGRKPKKIGKPVKSKKYAEKRAAELEDTHRATGGQYRSQYVEEIEIDEDAGIVSGLVGLALGAKGAYNAAKKSKRMRDYPKNFVKGVVDPRTYVPQKKKEQKEEFDIFDVILEHLVAEGYADTNKAALAIMVNMSEEWKQSIVEEVLDEAEGSYGQTPKADAAYTKLATTKGKSSKTKSLALKHAVRSAADSYNSDKPYSHRIKMTQSDRDYHRGQSENRGGDRGGIAYHRFDTGASGPGGKPKGKKLERQRKTGVSAD